MKATVVSKPGQFKDGYGAIAFWQWPVLFVDGTG